MPHITLVLHNIRSTHNVGSIFRTADGFGVSHIICSGYTPYPKFDSDNRLPHIAEKITKQIHKTALGAEHTVPFEYIADITAWLNNIDVPVYALEQSLDSKDISHFSPVDAFVLLLGEEVHGIEQWMLDYANHTLEIPMHGSKESFNVSVATGIALYALTR